MRSFIGPGPGRLFGRIAGLYRPTSSTLHWVIFGSIIVIAVGDIMAPLNVEVELLFFIPLALSFASFEPMIPIGTAIATTIGLVLGTVLSPPGCDLAAELTNRAVGGLSIWVTAGIAYSFVRHRLMLGRANEALQAEIIERKQYEEKERLLIREINHRAKNMLTVVDAMARQTAATSPEDFVEHFSARVQALSASQDLLVRNEWKGVEIEDLVRAQLAHFADLIGSRIAMQGPKLRLKPAGAQAVGLALHELATNAGKYGALSVDTGRVDVCWADAETFTISWTEREGPPVSPPQRRGFGTIVMGTMAESTVNGKVHLDYPASGLTWRLSCPAANALEPSRL
jgi:two-component sensor histidine kinase